MNENEFSQVSLLGIIYISRTKRIYSVAFVGRLEPRGTANNLILSLARSQSSGTGLSTNDDETTSKRHSRMLSKKKVQLIHGVGVCFHLLFCW